MSKPNEYFGDSDSKRVIRVKVLKRARQLFTVTSKPAGLAITLAGPEAADFSGLKHVLNFKPKEMMFVDLIQDGLIKALEKSKEIQYYEGDVKDCLTELIKGGKKAAFVNLDFCGRFGADRVEACRLASKLLNPRGLLFYTFFRGRESVREREAMGMAKNMLRSKTEERELTRCTYIAKNLMRAMGNEFELVFLSRYDSWDPKKSDSHSPMGVVGFQKMPLAFRDSRWMEALTTEMEGAVSNKMLAAEIAEGLRISALALAHEGKRSREIQEILNVPASRIAAWIATDTRRRKG